MSTKIKNGENKYWKILMLHSETDEWYGQNNIRLPYFITNESVLSFIWIDSYR